MWWFFFFCKQKTAYEMRISDWSSDVCSSDLEPGGDRVADLCGGARQGVRVGTGLAHAIGGVGLAQVVEHEGGGEDRRHRVGLVLASDVGGRAMYRLEHRRGGAGGVQVGRGGEPDPPGYRSAEVGEDVAEAVVGADHVVLLRCLHDDDAGGVDGGVGGGAAGVLSGALVDGSPPQ